MTDKLEEAGAAAANELVDAALFVRHDITQWSEWQNAVSAMVNAFAGLTCLINNAGIVKNRHYCSLY